MEEGQIVKATLLQADGKEKARPVLLLKQFPPYLDWLVAGISSKLHLQTKLDVLLDREHQDFNQSGLPYPGLIRTGFLGTIPVEQIQGSIGKVSRQTHLEIVQSLTNYLRER